MLRSSIFLLAGKGDLGIGEIGEVQLKESLFSVSSSVSPDVSVSSSIPNANPILVIDR
jgi:hypothetical protein